VTDHSLAARRVVSSNDIDSLDFDLLISSYNSSERVPAVFGRVKARRKIWIIHPEHGYSDHELPGDGDVWRAPDVSEAEFWRRLIEDNELVGVVSSARIAIDITGMTRPCIMLMPLMLRRFNCERVTVLYSDPHTYVSGAVTPFSNGAVDRVAQVAGLEGAHTSRYEDKDVLILGAGYDVELMKAVTEAKRSARHFLVVGLPALQSHMYQEARLQISRIQESIVRFSEKSIRFAPANNPFATAETLQALVAQLRRDEPAVNIYLSPVGPKPHALGFAWYMLCEPNIDGVSAIFPFATSYSKETSIGLARLHMYELELDWISANF
jgi:hypothetical protein